jgi:flagellar biosynthesis protein FlhF
MKKEPIRTNILGAHKAYAQNSSGEKNEDNRNSDSNIRVMEKNRIDNLENKIIGVETLLSKVYSKLDSLETIDNKQEIEVDEENYKLLDNLNIFYNSLIENEVDPDIASNLINETADLVTEETSLLEIRDILYGKIYDILGEPVTLDIENDRKPNVFIFVGPTGVGKTTTIAKIAANYALNKNKNVGLITADTYRIAAVEQLKTYAEILSMPVDVVYTPDEISGVIEKNSDKDMVLIDTAGRSYKNKSHFEELKTLIKAANADKIYLLLSMTTSPRTCNEIIKNYSFLEDYDIIMTKIDEAPSNGIILNTKVKTGKNLSYISTGQSVPDDIEVANTKRIAKNITGSINNE